MSAEATSHRVPKPPARRVILLGASNLTRGFDSVLKTTADVWGGPLEICAALGHGRSYGRASRVLIRELPGILECGLWQGVARSGPLPTAALVTDIGNDLIYEHPVTTISAWLSECFDRLAAMGATTVVTALPLDNVKGLSAARFHFFRRLTFPRGRISLAEISQRATQLDEAVRRLARERGFAIVEHRAQWYGFDPIHIRWRHRGPAWCEILSAWRGGERFAPRHSRLARSLYLTSRAPHERRLFGVARRHLQPAARFADGTTLSIY